MDAQCNGKRPIMLQMALSSDRSAFKAFLDLDEAEQDKVIVAAGSVNGVMEMRKFVSDIGNVKAK